MAKLGSYIVFLVAITFFFFSISATQISGSGNGDRVFGRPVDMNMMSLKRQKLSHFKFYWHDTVSGNNPTDVIIVPPATNTSATNFGSISMFDDPLTLGPNPSSKLVGRAQGFLGFSSQEEISLMMAMNFVFFEGKYNGSVLTVLGRNRVFSKVREMPVIGESGVFRFARGYALARTYLFNNKTNDAIVEYNVYVMHY